MLIKGRKGFKFLNLLVVLHCSSKGIESANTVLSPVLQLATDDLSLAPAKGQAKNIQSSLLWPTGEQLELALESAVPGELGGSVCINEPKAEPRRSQPRSSVHLHPYWLLNIRKLKEAFKEICDLQDPMPGCRTNWKIKFFTEPKQCLWLKTENTAKSNCDVGSLRIQTVLNPKKHFVLHTDSIHPALLLF